MRIEQHIVAAWAKQLSDKLLKESISALEQMDSSEMLSGDDSGLKNVWEEICVQVQDEQSFFWDTYVETMESLLSGYVELLDRDARLSKVRSHFCDPSCLPSTQNTHGPTRGVCHW